MLLFSGTTLARVAFPAALGCVVALGCSSAESAADAETGGTGGSGGQTSQIRMGVTDPTGMPVAFGDRAQLVRQPKTLTDLWLETEPFQLVRLTLLPNGEQTPGAAALDRTQLNTEASGRVTLQLTAPATPTSFLLRAWVDGVDHILPKEVEVRISELGTTTVEAIPLYVGQRPIDRWTASVTVDQVCSDLSGSPPPDGSYANEMMHPPQLKSVTIANVPTGPKLAVVIRAAGYAWGCANLPTALEGAKNSVQVTVTNVPMHLGTQPLGLDLTLSSRAEWSALFEAPIAAALDATLDGAADDVVALLDAMQASLGSAGRAEFSTTRAAQGWDGQLRAALGASQAARSVRAPLERFLRAGLAEMKLDRAFETELSADAGTPRLALEKSFGFDAESVRVNVVGTPGFSADPRDSMLLGVELEFPPARLLLSSARAPAREEVDGADDVSEAIAELVSCEVVAETLLGYGLSAGTANADCDADCAVELCQDAVAELVDRANEASDGELARLSLAVTGPGQVGADAELTALDGSWLGKFSLGQVTADLGGNATAGSN